MHDLIAQFLSYARGAWRHRWYMVLAAWLVCSGGWVVVYQLPDKYEASTRVYIDTHSMLGPLLRGLAVDTNVSSQIAVMTRTLLSRPNMEKLARMTDLDLRAKTPQKMEALLTELRKDISIEGSRRGPNLYTISYEHSDPQLAKRVVQSLLTIFVESSLGASRKDTDSAQRFLDTQIKEYEAKLEAAENRLKDFKRKYVGMMPSDGRGYFQRLESAMAALQEAKLQLQEAEKRRDEIKRQLTDEESEFVALGPGHQVMASPYDGRIQSLQMRLDDLLLKYTDEHPEVVGTKRTIAELEQKRDQEREEAQAAGEGEGQGQATGPNPIYQQMKIALAEADANVASLRARTQEYQKRAEELRKMVDTIPQIEAELKSLNRDYGLHKKNYDTLVARRESAEISQEAEQSSDSVKFRIIDPPFVPSKPSSPNRPLLMSGVLLGGMGVGAALALLFHIVRPTFDTRRGLAEVTGLPVLGSVSMVWTPAQIRERRAKIALFGASAFALMLVYGALLAQQFFYSSATARVAEWISRATGWITG